MSSLIHHHHQAADEGLPTHYHAAYDDAPEVKVHSAPRASGPLASTSLWSSESAQWAQGELSRVFRTGVRHRKAITTASLVLLGFLLGTVWEGARLLPTPGSPGVNGIGISPSITRSLLMTSQGVSDVAQVDEKVPSGGKPTDVLDGKQLQAWSLHESGFDAARPAVTPGASGESTMRMVPYQVISWYPRIVYFPAFVDPARCKAITSLAAKHMTPSGLAYRPGESVPESQNVRTSQGCFLSAEMDATGALAWVEEKIASVTHIPVENGEPFNVLRYEKDQHYDSHYDTFDPKDFGAAYTKNQRIATFLTFLTDVEEGGETVFKREGKDNGNLTVNDWRTCADGLGIKVKPRMGDAVLFYSVDADNKLDSHSLHGACPVKRGTKVSMAKWLHNLPIGAPRKRGITQQ